MQKISAKSAKKPQEKTKPAKRKIAIYAGEISKFKGVDVLVEAFEDVAKKYRMQGCC